MILNMMNKKQQTNASANVVDGKLILSLPGATAPVVWQMDLAQAKASALEVLHNEAQETYTLTLKNPKGETVEVAAFTDRAHAVEGLMAASNALKNAHGQIRGTSNASDTANDSAAPAPASKPQKNKRSAWMKVALALVALFILFTIWSSIVPRPVNTGGEFAPVSGAQGFDPQTSSGVPVSADAFLEGR